MKVPYPKVLSDVHGQTLAEYCVETHEETGAERIVVITGFKGELVRDVLGERVEYAHQEEQLGTGHAALQAEGTLSDWDGIVMVTMGDMPFLTVDMFRSVLDAMKDDVACVALGLDWPAGKAVPAWGRFIRNEDGSLKEIIEQKDCSSEQAALRELNANVYAARKSDLFRALNAIGKNNAQGEYYLTDIVGVLVAEGKKVATVLTKDAEHMVGINNPDQLQQARELHVHESVGSHE